MRTGVTWKLKLGSTLCALGAGLGLALAGGPGPDEPTPRPPKPARTETKPAEPKFVLADATPRKEFVDPQVFKPAQLTLATFGADGRLTTRTTDLTPVHDAILKLTGTKPASKPTFEVLAYGPGGRSIVHGLYVMEKTAFTELMPIGFIKRDLEQRCKAVLETPTGRLVVLNDGLKSDTPGFLWSPDGGTVYSVVSDSSEMLRPTPPFIFRGTSHVTTRIDVATGERQRLALPDNAMPLGFSPDGKTLLLRTTKESLFKDDESQLFVATLAEDPKQPATLRALTQLTKGYEGHYGAQYSPDGKRAILTKTGFMPYPLDLMPAKERPKDSTSIPLYPVRRYEILDLATDTITPLTTQPTAVPDFAREVRWSPDGTRVAFADAKGWSHGAAGMQVLEPHVVSCDPDGRDPVKVPFPMPVGPERFSYGGYGNYGPSLVGWR